MKEKFIPSHSFLFIDKILLESSSEFSQLEEGLIKSYSIETCIAKMSDRPFIGQCKIQRVSESKFSFLIVGRKLEKFKYLLDECSNFLGWQPSGMILVETDNSCDTISKAIDVYNSSSESYSGIFSLDILKESFKENTIIAWFTMEPKFDLETHKTKKRSTSKVSDFKVERFIYHTTNERNLQKILKIGLVPKSKNKLFNYPDRIYFHTVKSTAETSVVLTDLELEKPILLTIDTDKIKNFMWYKDPNFTGAIFTYQNVPPSAIINQEKLY